MRKLLSALWCVLAPSLLWAETEAVVHYLKIDVPLPPTLSALDEIPDGLGIDGAQSGLKDNRTTGRFLGHSYELETTVVGVEADYLSAAKAALAKTNLLILDAPESAILAIADLSEARDALLINATNPAMGLRDDQCRANLLHSAPSLGMRTDALAQFFVKKRWKDLVLIAGTHSVDMAYADAMRASLRKFGLKLSGEKTWAFDADMRRNAAQEVPLFTQDFGDYDALIVADELGDFGRYLLYNTWQARPVVGSEGLSAKTWADVVEQWGALQLQSRFNDDFGRSMQSNDYGAWAAMRAIGEAVTRTNASDAAILRAYILSGEFELAGFKGRPMTFRSWNGQLRQPIPLVHPRALVASAPLEGFLHQRSELDTLGLDKPESKCEAFQ